MRCPLSCSSLFTCLGSTFSEIIMIFSQKKNTNTSPSASIFATQHYIGTAISDVLMLGMTFLAFTSLGGAFISGCPFQSAISDFLRLIFEIPHTISKRIYCERFLSKSLIFRWLSMGTLTLLWFALFAALAYATLQSGNWILLFFIPGAIGIAYSAQKEVSHKPQKQKISHLALGMFLFVALSIILAMYHLESYPIFILLYCIGVFGIAFACWMVSKMSKSMSDTGEIDAIAWFLITTPPQHPAIFFKKAAQMTSLNCIGVDYRPRLLESLMPLLTLFIILHSAPQHPTRSSDHSPSSTGNMNSDDDPDLENLEIYVACLARLSEFEDCEGSLGCLREDARQHPKLEQPLIRKLVVLADPEHGYQVGLRNAATKVLKNYKLDREGNPVRSHATVALNAAATVLRRAASLNRTRMLNVGHCGLNSQEGHEFEQAS